MQLTTKDIQIGIRLPLGNEASDVDKFLTVPVPVT